MTISSSNILYSSGNNDECYTPEYAVLPIIKYIPKGATVWTPFDTKDSFFVKSLRSAGVKVIRSHIESGKDFFNYEPKKWDIMISNPPFSNKRAYFERALSFNKPFALIMTNTWLNDSAPKQLFAKKQLQLLMFQERMKFNNQDNTDNKITFSSSYYCYDFLPNDIIMDSLKDYGY